MKKNQRTKGGVFKSTIKALARSTFLAGSLLLSNTSAHAANAVPASKGSVRERVELVREALKRKLVANQSPHTLSYSEKALAQWGNWGNWMNWNNWLNWNNWNNWRNWGNWGNY